MGLSFGYREEVSIPAPLGTKKCPEPINENSAERSYGENGEYEQLLQPIFQHNSAPNHSVGNLPHLEWLRDINGSESDSPPPQRGNKKKKGCIRGDDWNLQYLDGNKWVPAIYHHNIRAFLINQASKNGRYTYPRERGPDHDDVTSFLESQKNWGPLRDENWAEILYVFQKEKHHMDPTYEPKYWKFNGKLVISGHDRQPMLQFRDLPDTLSSALHGRDMEAIKRTDPRIQQRDFMARMPPRHTTPAGTRRPVQTPSSIGMRMTRFRQQHGMLSWTGRDGSRTIRSALWERLPPENQQANSIRGLQPLTIHEQHEIRKGNAGKFLNRAGKRALGPEERNRRRKIEERRLKMREEEKSIDTEQGRDHARLDDNGSMRPPPPITKQDRHPVRHVRLDNRSMQHSFLSAEKSRHQARHGRPDSRSMQPPPNAERGGQQVRQSRLDNRSMQPPPPIARHGRPDSGNPSRRNSTSLPLDFNLDPSLTDFHSTGSNPLRTGNPSLTRGIEEALQSDFASLFEGLTPAGFNNNEYYPSQSNHSSPGKDGKRPQSGGWNFDYTLPAPWSGPQSNNNNSNSREAWNLDDSLLPPPVGSVGDLCPSPKNYPSPPDYTASSAIDQIEPYYLLPPY